MSRYLLLLVAAVLPLHAAWQAGAASVDITPTQSIWLAGYADRTKPSESVRQPIHCKALAIKDDAGAVSVVVTLDLVGFKREFIEPIAERVSTNLHIPRERLLFNASHTHSAPVAGDLSVYALIMGSYLEQQKQVIPRYTKRLSGLIYDAIAQAVGHLQPATAAFDQGYAGFAVN